ncbi:DNA-processing protein DprA [Intestinimonas butyriciproducens]|uniref:DNA-processing protein DprA n=1 Tax=Intestinimonas butyriciproducens TaxID=1297617 RepID=UPI00243195F5|nr:DNA-processing protein DprA [Intestinimonas butyriciproducens]
MASLKYWLWLTTRKGLRPEHAVRLLEHFGTPEGAYFADPGEYDLLSDLPLPVRTALQEKHLAEAEGILADCERLGLRILTLGDADYPDRLKNIYDPPAVLYVKGRLPAFDEEIAVAVVGSRRPSEYGKRMAGRLGLELAREGALVVSGIAQGLDTEAVRGALKGGGPVVSVLGCGIDVAYPRENRFLYEDVAATGALLSEYPPGTPPEGWHFPVRNRIISGVSLGVVAVECGVRSGTMTTVRQALDQDRDVFAVPGNADAPMSEGPNRLIQQGARLVTCARDVLREYEDRFPGKVRRPVPLSGEEAAARLEPRAEEPEEKHTEDAEKAVDKSPERAYIDRSALTDDQIELLAALEEKKLLADDLIELTQIPARRVLSALTMLQVQGHVAERPGRRFEALVRLKTE